MKKLLIELLATLAAIVGIVALTAEADTIIEQVLLFVFAVVVLLGSTKVLEHYGIIKPMNE